MKTYSTTPKCSLGKRRHNTRFHLPTYPNSKIAGHRHIDTPGTVYLEVFVDSPQGCIVLSFSFAGAAVQKTKGPADT